ncbi:uncharacterized protein MAM_00444 [Metarhizium album ARSEF 1941]|uniref:Uncharacterized protein n=1 Tax=Metarhizium album (strain ARSEF 1941) TaxID=1081103 RepID=A0A0B2X6Q7_METAS|nr:uncharacterized protein MAM_00444 [Metarhizium album ARSEF 1941]KHO01443.1 hypothetical protein MAM_00444 [Metarhizium album ARSEF 1941]
MPAVAPGPDAPGAEALQVLWHGLAQAPDPSAWSWSRHQTCMRASTFATNIVHQFLIFTPPSFFNVPLPLQAASRNVENSYKMTASSWRPALGAAARAWCVGVGGGHRPTRATAARTRVS